MSNFPTGLKASPHGDALLPNRTGGGMRELREALERLLTEDETVRLNVQVLAPVIEVALRVAIRKAHGYGCSGKHLHAENEDRCVTAGVAAMVEKS